MSDYMNIRPVAWIAGPKKKPELARLQWSATLAPHDVGRCGPDSVACPKGGAA